VRIAEGRYEGFEQHHCWHITDRFDNTAVTAVKIPAF
jgi:hypothetical protein